MNGYRLTKGTYRVMVVLFSLLTGCSQRAGDVPVSGTPAAPAQTSNPIILNTLQAEVAQTAAWVNTFTQGGTPLPSTPLAPTIVLSGTPISQRTGSCPIADGFELQPRDGFCIASPSSWAVLNVDGGMAAFLKTTPGQAISLQPDWAESTLVCHLMIYIAIDNNVADYLASRHDQLALQGNIKTISPISSQTLGEIGIQGFSWEDNEGGQGDVYGEMVSPNHLLNISSGGTQCSIAQLIPTIETLRLN